MSEKLKLQTNVPVEIALKFDDGKPMTGDYGDSVMYTLSDDRLWFAPPICAQKITEMGITRGEVFRVVKAEVTRGNRRSIEYQIARVEPAASNTVAAVSQQAPQQVPPASATPINSRGRDLAVEALTRAFQVAIDGMVNARQYGAAQGLDLKFNEGNICSVACSIYINAAKESKTWAA